MKLKLKVYYFDDYIDVPIKNAVKIDKDNLSKYGDLVFLSYVDIRFNFLIEQKNLKIVDLTGAGDLFAAGFLHGYVNNLSLKESLEKGTDMSSKVIQQIGARL